MNIKATAACLVIGLAMLVVGAPRLVLANGGYFFSEEDEQAGEQGTVYFGFVRDASGIGIADAGIRVLVKTQNVEYVGHTNLLGRYRMTDVGKTVDPHDVEVNVVKKGYRVVGKVDRLRTSRPGVPVEINFTLKSEEQAAK
jgi:hypothetical protein